MTNSATSTKARPQPSASGFQAWHFFLLLSMIGATVVVMVSRETHPAALLLLSAAVIAAGFVGLALSRAVAGFFSRGVEPAPVAGRSREELERQKALVLRSIKELEFDNAMGKVSDADFATISARLRTRALSIMQDLERTPAPRPAAVPAPVAAAGNFCTQCGTSNDIDARFCKSCGAKLAGGR
jgi:hypothetical protein